MSKQNEHVNYNIVASSNQSTVVSEYVSKYVATEDFQSEAALEQIFINQLEVQGYEYLKIHDSAALISNLRKQLEKLNNYKFSDSEWDRFFKESIASWIGYTN
ncbi:MAG: hypothetical protein ACRCUS_04825 [Anaerovoracaceae bacterium]